MCELRESLLVRVRHRLDELTVSFLLCLERLLEHPLLGRDEHLEDVAQEDEAHSGGEP